MPVNVTNTRHRDKLKEEVEVARRSLQRFRDMRRALVHDYAGDLWTEDTVDFHGRRPQRIVLDLMCQAISQYVMALAANRPQAKVTSNYRALMGFAAGYGLHLNGLAKRGHLEQTIQSAVLEACVSPMGVVRVGNLPIGNGPFGDPGEPGVENISFDDWFHDTRAKTDERMRFMGHTYECNLGDLREDDNLDQSKVARLIPGRRPGTDIVEADPVKDIEAGREWDDYDDTVVLCDVWLPFEQQIVTLDHRFDFVLQVQDWEGPPRGPYHFLRFMRVPDSISGLPGAYGMKAMFDLMNSIWRKLSRQARNQKHLTVVKERSADMAQKIKRGSDGEVVLGNPDDLSGWAALGVDVNLAQFGIQVQDQFNRSSGNYEHMAGLGPSADTVGQERIIQGNVGARLGKMQNEVANFTREIFESLGYHLWGDEVYAAVEELPLYSKDLGETINIPVEWMPSVREGDYWQYNFDVVPHALAYQSPAEQAQQLMAMLSGVIMPAIPYMQEQGMAVDFNATFEALARLQNLPELREILVPSQPPTNEQPGPNTSSKDGPGKPPVTNRTYTRKNVSTGGTPQGRRAAMAAIYSGSATPQQQSMVSTPG